MQAGQLNTQRLTGCERVLHRKADLVRGNLLVGRFVDVRVSVRILATQKDVAKEGGPMALPEARAQQNPRLELLKVWTTLGGASVPLHDRLSCSAPDLRSVAQGSRAQSSAACRESKEEDHEPVTGEVTSWKQSVPQSPFRSGFADASTSRQSARNSGGLYLWYECTVSDQVVP